MGPYRKSRSRPPSPLIGLPGQYLVALVALLVVATVIVVVPRAIAEGLKKPPAATSSESKGQPSSGNSTVARPIHERPTITFNDGKLTMQLQNRPLPWVLEAISREARVAIVTPEGIGDESISAQARDLPVDQVLRQILASYDAFFFYGVVKEAPATLRVVWVYPKGRGQRYVPEPPDTWASTKELVDDARTNADPLVRARAVSTLVDRKGQQALDVVLGALQDRDDDVRTDALYAALKGNVSIPKETLARMALSDPSPSVRFLALDNLAGDPDARVAVDLAAVATQALDDSSHHVREKAREILQRLPGDLGRNPNQQPRR